MRQLIRDRNFGLLLVGQTLNMFGDWALLIVLGVWVKQLTGSSGAAGVVFLLFAAPALLAPATGLLVDRFPRRRTMIVNDLLSALLVSALVLVSDRRDVWIIYAVTFGYGLSGQVYQAARGGLLHSMADMEQLGEINGLLSSVQQGTRIVGPFVGAGIFVLLGGGGVALVDTGTFLLSAGTLALLRAADLEAGGACQARGAGAGSLAGLLREMGSGIGHIATAPDLRRIIVATGIALCTAGLLEVGVFSLVDQGLHRPPTFVAVLLAMQGIGAVLGGLSVAPIMARLGEARAGGVGLGICALGVTALIVPTLPFVVPGMIVAGIGLPVLVVAYTTLLQRRTPVELQGRVLTGAEALMTIPYTLSVAVGAVTVALIGFRFIFAANAAVMGAVGLFLLAPGLTLGAGVRFGRSIRQRATNGRKRAILR